MKVTFHPHALSRLPERGATEQEVVDTVIKGEKFQAKFNRTGFRLNIPFDKEWNGKNYNTKQIEAYAVFENECWLVITIIVKYF